MYIYEKLVLPPLFYIIFKVRAKYIIAWEIHFPFDFSFWNGRMDTYTLQTGN
jgi:hypothetical protein